MWFYREKLDSCCSSMLTYELDFSSNMMSPSNMYIILWNEEVICDSASISILKGFFLQSFLFLFSITLFDILQ